MKFTKTGNFQGDAEIFINGKSVGKEHLDKTVASTFSIEETFDVGEDTGSPIIEDVYAVPSSARHCRSSRSRGATTEALMTLSCLACLPIAAVRWRRESRRW